jgi:hypothetical protein
MEAVKIVQLIPNLLMTRSHALQRNVLKDNSWQRKALAKIAKPIQDLKVMVSNVEQTYVVPEKSCLNLDNVNYAKLMKLWLVIRKNFVQFQLVLKGKEWVRKECALTVMSTRLLLMTKSHALCLNAKPDRRSPKKVHVSTARLIPFFTKIRRAVLSQWPVLTDRRLKWMEVV